MSVSALQQELSLVPRLEGGIILSLQRDVSDVRARVISNALADQTACQISSRSMYFCSRCHHDASPKTLHMLEGMPKFATVYEFVAFALRTTLPKLKSFVCPKCHGCISTHTDWHLLMREARKDLVVRISCDQNGKQTYQLLWMNVHGQYSHVSHDEIPVSNSLTVEQHLQLLEQLIAEKQLEAAGDFAKRALRQYPGNHKLTLLAFTFVDTAKRGVAEAIAEARIQVAPKCSSGYALLANVYISGYVQSGGIDEALLESAFVHAIRALVLDSRDRYAELAYCNSLRLRNEPEAVVSVAYKKLIRRCPDYTPPLYNYGLHCLVHRPLEALQLFERGHCLEPGDADYLVGQARALRRLGKIDESEVVLRKAKNAHPENSLLQMISNVSQLH